MPVVSTICAAAQVILPRRAPLGGALVEETALLARWLAQPGVRVVHATSGYAVPRGSAGRLALWSATARSARIAAQQAVEDDAALVGRLQRRPKAGPLEFRVSR
jgi:DNA polymerase-3 subunit epsilon